MKKFVMFASVAVMLSMALISCSESTDSLSAEDRATRDGRRDVQEKRTPPGPGDAGGLTQDVEKPDDSSTGGD